MTAAVLSSSSLCRGAHLWFFFFSVTIFVSSPLSQSLLSFWSVLLQFLSFLFSSVFFVSPPFPQRSWPLFIEAKGAAFYSSHGSSRLVGHWARLPRFSGWCAVGGRPLCSVGGLQAREREGAGKNSKKSTVFPLPRCLFRGEEER